MFIKAIDNLNEFIRTRSASVAWFCLVTFFEHIEQLCWVVSLLLQCNIEQHINTVTFKGATLAGHCLD